MSDRQDDLNPASNLAPFADALQKLAPQPPHLSRDALLFLAGQASASPRLPKWTWQAVAGGFAALSLVLIAFAATPSTPIVQYNERIVYVPQPAEAPTYAMTTPVRETPPEPKVKKSAEASETAKLLKQRRDVYRWGVEMLPESRSNGGGRSEDVAARDLTRWLNLPPGTFALPAHQPKKPVKEDDEE
jgi:hypothetical protein